MMSRFLLNITKLLAINAQTLKDTSEQVHTILSTIVGPCLSVIGSIGVLYMIVMGVQYAKAENDEKRAEVKRRLVNLAIGVLIMGALIALCMAVRWDVLVPELFGYFAK